MNSVNGLGFPEQKFIKKLYETKGPGIKLFKVMNVLGGQYNDNTDKLEATIRTRYHQAIKDLTESRVPNANQWFVIDAKNGKGIEELIRAFADTLPVHLLRQLEQGVRAAYSHIIHEKIESRFLDYVAHVACLVAVFPVDFTAQRKDVLSFAIKSLVIMAEYMFTNTGKQVSSTTLEGMIAEIIDKKKYRASYVKEIEDVEERTGKFFVDLWRDLRGSHETRRVERHVLDGYHTGIGGIDALEFTVAIGLALRKIYNRNDEGEVNDDQLRREIVRSKRSIKHRSEIIDHLKVAGRWEHKKLEIAQEIYAGVRASLGSPSAN